ncbi:hypothetical protein EAI_02607 [Harpegnathos saltator]|uniref:Uncharacterized protein n=1 Tax=Harpegnathos saltator TaxID=610380 RepID=E2B388_HARSA|nr:hypothetical protein EAI_02607 [Harpegnathos saltator]
MPCLRWSGLTEPGLQSGRMTECDREIVANICPLPRRYQLSHYIVKMYAAGVDVNAKQVNYYMPAQHEDEAPPSKKIVPRPPAMHILGRRYALTATAYKYLNIGISVGAEPVIDIVIDDNRNKQLLLPIKTWNALMGQRADIQRFLQANFYKSSSPPMRIEELTITSCKMYNSQIVKLTF